LAGREIIYCDRCGKPLIHRLADGSLEFVFGGKQDAQYGPPVQMWIFGEIRMKCWREYCRHINMIGGNGTGTIDISAAPETSETSKTLNRRMST
jgi:hypothetical protein